MRKRHLFIFVIILVFIVEATVRLCASTVPLWAENLDNKTVRVLLADNLKECEITSGSGFVIQNGAKELKIDNLKLKVIVGVKGSSPLQILNESGVEILSAKGGVKIFPQGKDAELEFNNLKFKGSFALISRKDVFKIVNYVSLNDYLCGVLPKELRTNLMEAGKAQAVISRTLVLYKIQKNKDKDFDVYSDFRDQVYAGSAVSDEACNKAVDLTNGIILTYKGKIAPDLCYHSTCGGATASNKDLFLNAGVAYLSPVKCDLETFFDFLKSKEETRLNKLEQAASRLNKQESLCKSSGFYKWEAEVRAEDILNNLPEHSAGRMQEIEDVKIMSRSDYGRVLELKIIARGKNIMVRGNRIRFILTFKNDKGAKQILYSTNFNIEKKGDIFRLKGAGWGHGIGMCQMGALKLASLGASFDEILEFYYTGAKVDKK